jgi:hypothetical protein
MSLLGEFSVNQAGAATYTIPIAVPPGTVGVMPSLSLEYTSQGINGLLGVGWMLGGLPSIGHCSRTMAQDGAVGGVNFDANDRFCMDGQRLVVVSGAYGADGALYHAEVDTFAKIVSHGTAGNGPAWFEVHTKSGQVMEFGRTTDSQILAQGKATARIWALNKLSDSKANYFTVAYANDTTNGQYYPNRIDYTGNTTTGVATYNSVQFTYTSRLDIAPFYQAGSLSQTTVLLTDIKTFAGSSLVADYSLTYQQSANTKRSILTGVKSCGADGMCLPPTNIIWAQGDVTTATVMEQTPFRTGYVPSLWHSTWADVNGDGKADLVMTYQDSNGLMAVSVALSNGDGTLTVKPEVILFSSGYVPSLWNYTWVDVNGDGKADLVLTYQDVNGLIAVSVALSNGDGTFTVKPEVIPFSSGYVAAGWHYTWVDVNGDAKADLVMTYQDGNGLIAVSVALSNGDGTFTVKPEVIPFSSGYVPSLWKYTWTDVNGDGKADLMLTYQDANGQIAETCVLSNGDGTFAVMPETIPFNSGYVPSLWHYNWVDANGDGKADLVMTYQATNGQMAVTVAFSRGDGTLDVKPEVILFSAGYVPSLWNYTWTDVNGDGKADLVWTYQDTNGLIAETFILSKGDGTFAVMPETISFNSGYVPSLWHYAWADMNGDGKADLVLTYQDANGEIATQAVASTPVLLAAQSIQTGLGATTSISYSPLSAGGSFYARGTSATYPTIDVAGPFYVVSRVDVSNGVGGTYSSTYSYAGARVDLSGRGFLGFAQMAVNDLQTGITDTTTYRQDFPYLGLVASTTRSFGTQTLGQSTNTYRFSNASGTTTISPGSAPYQVSLLQNVSSGNDLDGSALPTVTTANQYDAFGNATQVVVSTPDGFSKSITNTFTNDTTNWYLGRLVGASVTSVAP